MFKPDIKLHGITDITVELLNKYNINAYLIATIEYYGEQKGTRGSVLYEDDGKS